MNHVKYRLFKLVDNEIAFDFTVKSWTKYPTSNSFKLELVTIIRLQQKITPTIHTIYEIFQYTIKDWTKLH